MNQFAVEAVVWVVVPALYIGINIACMLAWLTSVGNPRDMITPRDKVRLLALLLFGGPLVLLAWLGSWCDLICEWSKMLAATKRQRKRPVEIVLEETIRDLQAPKNTP